MIVRIFALILVAAGLLSQPALALETPANMAMVVDFETGTVLYEKNAERPMPPASMSKLMTLNMVFEALDSGALSLDDTFVVSAKASQKGGSKMFVREGSRVRVEDLIQGVIVQSGNDACIVLAEGLAGTEEEFAKRMNARAKELGMLNSNFVNATGWPGEGQLMSARDLVFIARRIITKFPQYYKYFGEKTFTWDGIVQNNRNPLLYLDIGADGLKTGHTNEAGFGLVGSAVQNGRRVVFMLGGMDSAAQRSSEGERIVRWAFREFAMKSLFNAGQTIGSVRVWLGAQDTVDMVLPDAVALLLPKSGLDKVTASYTYLDTVEAPIEAGQQLGTLAISIADNTPLTYPLVAATAVEPGGFFDRVKAAADLALNRIRRATSGN